MWMVLLSVEETAARLGVKNATVYAYVSRGHLRRRRQPGSRRSWFDAADVERVARRGRPRRTTRPPALDFTIETALTTLDDDVVRYRGRNALSLARTAAFEEVAEWLWSGDRADSATVPWAPRSIELPEVPDPRDRLRLAVVLTSAADPPLPAAGPAAIKAHARSLIATMTAAVADRDDRRAARLSLPGRTESLRGTIAGRLWGALTPRRATPEAVAALNAALVLLADHELAVSTVAARVAASARADAGAVVLTGLGPLAGPLHGGASRGAYALLEAALAAGVDRALAEVAAKSRRVPGFGHRVYGGGDPRATVLLDLVRHAYPAHRALAVADRLVAVVRRRRQVEPNIDFALAVFASAADMRADAGETIFTIARTAGWIAHALEEWDEAPLRYRARAVPRRTVPAGTDRRPTTPKTRSVS